MRIDDDLIAASCATCGDRFERPASDAWKRLCVACWRRGKSAQAPASDDRYTAGFTAGRLAGLRDRLDAYARGVEAGRAQALADAAKPAAAAATFDKARLRQLLQLCHPDRHGGAELATAVTTWLLSLRKGGE